RMTIPGLVNEYAGIHPGSDAAGRALRTGCCVPFTLSHPAAVLPPVREPFLPAALLVGRMAPDVPYFVPVPRYAGAWYEPFVNATVTHQWPGMLTVAVPTAAVLLGLWWIVRSPLVDLVLRRRGEPVPSRSGADTGAAPRLRAVAWLV